MGWLIDIAFPVRGFCVTLLRIFQFGFVLDNEWIDFNVSFYRFGIHVHFVMEDNNRCLEIENHRKQ